MVRDSDGVDRRTILRATAGLSAAGMAGLAGCNSDSSGSDSGDNVTVGPSGQLVFDPQELTVSTGTTVTWSWDSDNHNIVVESQPEGANWEGTEGGESTLYNTGHEYEHTFETAGTYEYYCSPHRSAGMTGTVVVE